MTSLLIAFVVVLLAPLFMATWRTSLLGLSLQGVLLSAMAWRVEGADGWVSQLDLLVLRGLLAPALLYRVLSARGAPPRNDVLPPNLLAWAGAVGLVILGVRLATALVPVEGDEQRMVGVVAAAVLLAFLVLSTQDGVFSQIVGVLRLENAIALLELSGEVGPRGPPEGYLGIRLGLMACYLVTVVLLRAYLDHIEPNRVATVAPAEGFDD